MRIYSLKRMSIPKIAVLATGLAAAVLAATISPPPAQALPSFGTTCATSSCHTAGGSVTATPSTTTPASGAAYTVAIVLTNAASGNSGYNISLAGVSITTGGPAAGKTFSANMTAPAAAGTYTYTVAANTASPPGAASSITYSITVGSTPTTVPPTTVPPTTVPPTTVPPVSITHIRSLSPDHGRIGTKVTIKGTDFGTSGVVKFGRVVAKVSSWTNTKIVVKVPAGHYGHSVLVTVTPTGATASNRVKFSLRSREGNDGHQGHHGHFVRLGGDFGQC